MVRDKVVTDVRSSNFTHQSNALCTLLVSAVIEFSRVHADSAVRSLVPGIILIHSRPI